jgi:hypothetical protein
MAKESTEGPSTSVNASGLVVLDKSLRRLAAKLPGSVRNRLLSSLEHFDRAFALFQIDREIASFRAITGEEEAATALMKAIALRRYRHANHFNPHDHQHKAAVIACVRAIGLDIQPILAEFQLVFDFEKRRIDIKVPLSNFDVIGGENLAIQPVEPLDFVHTRNGTSEGNVFKEAIDNLAAKSQFENVRRMVKSIANSRNTLLYASDSSLHQSKATLDILEQRKTTAMVLLVLAVMILQSRKQLRLVGQAISAFLEVISKLPRVSLSC